MQHYKTQLHNLHNLLPTQESMIQLSIFTGIPLTNINSWLDPNKKSVPKSDSLIIMAKYFNCTVDYLLDLADRREGRIDGIK